MRFRLSMTRIGCSSSQICVCISGWLQTKQNAQVAVKEIIIILTSSLRAQHCNCATLLAGLGVKK